MAPVIDGRGLAKTYPNGTAALAPVDLAVQPGELVVLLGPSGCGKSTLLNLVAGLIAPSAGSIAWWGRDALPEGDAAHRIAYVFQSPTLMPWARVAANVRLPLDLEGRPRPEADAAVARAVARVGLERFARHFPQELSGGMQMRTSIARALVTDPALLLMDEPFGALDEFTRARLDDELLGLWRDRSLTVLFVTHSIAEAVYLATRIVVMGARPGRIVDEIEVRASLPRGDAWRTSTAFASLCARVLAKVREAGVAADALG
jgi:NitT/TauT family transport system ATP-binding protein